MGGAKFGGPGGALLATARGRERFPSKDSTRTKRTGMCAVDRDELAPFQDEPFHWTFSGVETPALIPQALRGKKRPNPAPLPKGRVLTLDILGVMLALGWPISLCSPKLSTHAQPCLHPLSHQSQGKPQTSGR
jgi:hypothetical protein